jgi:hypothetical protein
MLIGGERFSSGPAGMPKKFLYEKVENGRQPSAHIGGAKEVLRAARASVRALKMTLLGETPLKKS